MAEKKIKPTLLIADDHRMFLEGLRGLLAPHYEIVGEAEDGEELIRQAQKLQPEVIVSDLSMPGLSGLKALRELKRVGVGSKVVIVTMHEEPEFAAEAIQGGAAGYVLKNAASSELLTAIDEALSGGVYITPRLAREAFEIAAGNGAGETGTAPELNERHRDILRLLAKGLVAKEIGARLNISPRTVEYHKYKLIEKLGVKTTAELVQFAVQQGLTEGE
ncbi:MAG: DNA-binding NarL/FixJ family response regulator [Verrucomicrobiales bacterium]|jgi:DNA-binding NarL/FixJ family response regulator